MSNRRVVKYRKPIRINIGVIIFSIIFIYILIISFQYLTKEHISIYEVNKKSIADDNTCYGVILRDEVVYNSKDSGYINYYVGDGEKVGKNSTVYTVDETGEVYNMLASNDTEKKITDEDSEKIRSNILSFKKSYTDSNFSKTLDFKNDIENTILDLANVNMLSNLNTVLKESVTANSFQVEKSDQTGVICYSIDGMENLNQNDITESTFKQSDNKEKRRNTSTPVKSGSPIYKLIKSEDWSIIIPLTKEQHSKIADKNSINITFTRDNLSTNADIVTFQNGNNYYAKLSLDKYMIRYIDDRFIEVELLINSAEGLKIPMSSIIKKEFYLIPDSYFTVGGEKDKKGLVKESYSKNGKVEYKFIATDVYFEDGNKYDYVDANLFSAGDWVRNAETQQRYKISNTKSLEGVYNVNKGYCVFRRIEKEYENQEYCIIKEDTSYGVSVYDHIVVNADSIKEQDIIY